MATLALNRAMRVGLLLSLFFAYIPVSMADVYIYEIERAGYKFGQSDKKGEIAYATFVKEFRAYPWIEEIERWRSLRQGVSPTLSVINSTKSSAYWVSMAGDKNRHAFLLGIEYKKLMTPRFGIGNAKEVHWLEIFITEEQQVVEETFALFFQGASEKLMARLRTLDKFDEMESKRATWSR